jgi:hypothetical protein
MPTRHRQVKGHGILARLTLFATPRGQIAKTTLRPEFALFAITPKLISTLFYFLEASVVLKKLDGE